MFSIESQEISIRLVDAQYRLKTLSTFRRKAREADGFIIYIRGGHTVNVPGVPIFTTGPSELLYLPYRSTYESRLLEAGTEYYEINFQLFQNGEPISLMDNIKHLEKDKGEKYLPLIKKVYDIFVLQQPLYQMNCISIIIKIISLLLCEDASLQNSMKDMEPIRHTVSYIRDHYDEDMSLKELAALSGLCVSSLKKHFIQCFGMTPVKYRTNLRIEHAKLLLTGGFSIADTASKVGFQNCYYFSNVFKKYTGLTPGQYKKEN
jgi:YesN/AraC family two-component response regulator